MRRLLLCSGVYGKRRGIESLRRFAAERRPDAILFAGGILSSERHMASHSSSDCGLTLEDQQFIRDFTRTLGDLAIFSAVRVCHWIPELVYTRTCRAGKL
jgi:hypothetical protein